MSMQMQQLRRGFQPAAHIELLPIRIAHGCVLMVHTALGRDFITAPLHFRNGILDRLRHDHNQSPFLMFGLLLLESGRQAAAEAPTVGIAHLPKRLCRIFLLGPDLPASACYAIIGVEKRQLAELEVVLHADKPDLRNLDLRRPIYRQLAAYGHMGREDLGVTWEKTDRVDALLAALK